MGGDQWPIDNSWHWIELTRDAVQIPSAMDEKTPRTAGIWSFQVIVMLRF